MGNINQVTLEGNLGDNPTLNYTGDALPVTNFSLATSETLKKKDQEPRTITTWHRVALFGNAAEWIAENVGKGDNVLVSGKIRNTEREVFDKENNTKIIYRTSEILASRVKLLGKAQRSEE